MGAMVDVVGRVGGWTPAPGLTGEVEFTKWTMSTDFIECLEHGLALRVYAASHAASWFVLRDNDVVRKGIVPVGCDPVVVSNGGVAVGRAKEAAIAAAQEVLAPPAFRDDFTRLPDGKQRWTSRCGRACIEVWFDGTEWCYVAKAPGAATANGMVTRCGSEHAAKMGGSTAAAVMLNRLDAEPPFAKSDATKPRAELLPPRALLAVSRVLTHGAAKYGHENHLRAGDDVESRYMGATLRHLLAHMSGEPADGETGESHLAHAAADLLLMIERGAAAKE